MPDRTPIDASKKVNCIGFPAPAGVRPRAPIIRPAAAPARDNKQFLSVGRKSSRLRRLDSRGSTNK